MICKVCGYKFNKSKKNSKCPFCGEEISSQKQKRKKYNKKNNDNSLIARPHEYSSTIPQKFREDWFCSFEINKNELKMSRFLNGGQFSFLGNLILFIMGFIFLLGFIFFFPYIIGIVEIILIGMGMLFLIAIIFAQDFTYSTYRVNSSGIIVKTPLKEYFIPKEKIDSIACKCVRRVKKIDLDDNYYESFYDLFIILRNKDKHLFNKIDIDTGLCYKDRIQVKYLVDKFNEYLGFIQDEGDKK